MGAERGASVVWDGDLINGKGTVSADSSGAFSDLPVTWASRTETPGGKTSPEELIAAAHASCFAMALSNEMAKKGHPPSKLEISAVSSAHKGDAGWQIDAMDLEVKATAPGLDPSTFEEALSLAEDGCPVSKALRNGIDIRVKASLA